MLEELIDTMNAFPIGGYLITNEMLMASDIPIYPNRAFAVMIRERVSWDRAKDLLLSFSEEREGLLIRWKPMAR